jgi:hypothetical protein
VEVVHDFSVDPIYTKPLVQFLSSVKNDPIYRCVPYLRWPREPLSIPWAPDSCTTTWLHVVADPLAHLPERQGPVLPCDSASMVAVDEVIPTHDDSPVAIQRPIMGACACQL